MNTKHTPDLLGLANAEIDRLKAINADLRAALQSFIAPDANDHIQRLKDELFRAAPELEPKARAALAKARG